jgi:hypothetical protein
MPDVTDPAGSPEEREAVIDSVVSSQRLSGVDLPRAEVERLYDEVSKEPLADIGGATEYAARHRPDGIVSITTIRCVACRQPWPCEVSVLLDRLAAAEADRDAARAVLAPLLDEPWREIANYGEPERRCVFCDGPHIRHDAGCPVLRRDELLGRAALGGGAADGGG